MPILYAEEGRWYELHPEENAPYACDVLDAMCNHTPETYINPSPWTNLIYAFDENDAWPRSSFYEENRYISVKISFPFKDLKKD